MNIILRESFLQGCRRITADDRSSLLRVFLDLRAALSDPHRHSGLGMRKLSQRGLWEVRIGLDLRALFRIEAESAIFMFLGSHDEVRRFLRSFR